MSNQRERWDLVATAIKQRMAALRLTKAELSRRSDISEPTLTGYLRGEPVRRQDKQWALCDALGWTPESITDLLAGGHPTIANGNGADDLMSFTRAEVEAFAGRLERLESSVNELTSAMSEIRIALEGATPAKRVARPRR